MKQKKDYGELLKQRKYDPNKVPPPEQIVFLIENKNIGTLQNFVTLTGMQKSGKTTFMSAIIAAALTNEEKIGLRLRLPREKRRVCYMDTEQGDFDFYRTMNGVRSFIGIDDLPSNFDSYNFREDEPKDIIFLLEKYLETFDDCGLLVIDGILDLIESYNDEAESKRLVNILKKLTKVYNLLLVATLHKGKTTSNTLGHLGSMADRAAQSVLLVEKSKERKTFVLRPDFLRSADEFTPIEIYFNAANHRWEQTFFNPDSEPENMGRKRQQRPNEVDRELHKVNVAKIFTFQKEQGYKEFVNNISELYATGTNWAKECVRHLMHEGLIFKNADSKYTNEQQAKLYIK
jgi:KaiC/GvpD/RAD55 family RecA-like ATPase